MQAKSLFSSKFLAFIGLLTLLQLRGNAQVFLNFKSNGKMTSFPNSYGFDRSQPVVAGFDQDKSDAATFYKGRKKIVEDLKKAATEFEKKLATTPDLNDFYQRLWGAAAFAGFLNEERQWSDYLKDHGNDTNYATPVFAHFPVPPAMNEMRAGFQVIATEGKDPKPEKPGVPFSGADWIVRGAHPEFSFFFQQVDVFRQGLIETYNNDRPVEFKDISPEILETWHSELLALQKNADDLCNDIAANNFWDPSCEATKITRLLDDTRQSQWYQVLSKDFYLKWLWFSRGALRLNPLGFTTPDRLQYISNEEVRSRFALFDSIYVAKLKCDVCKFNPDSLAKVIKDQLTGRARFPEDSTAAVKKNQQLLDNFQTNRKQLNRFSWPVVAHEVDDPDDNKTIVVQQYDAAHRYQRIHNLYYDRTRRLPAKVNRREGENNIPDDVSAAVVVHNIPQSKQISIDVTEVDLKDASKAEIMIDTAIAVAASLYTQFNPLAATISGLVTTTSNVVPPGGLNAIPPPGPVSKSTDATKLEDAKSFRAAQPPRPTNVESHTFKVAGKFIDVPVQKATGDVVNCNLVKLTIVEAIVDKYNLLCPVHLHDSLATWAIGITDPGLCHFAARDVYLQRIDVFAKAVEERLKAKIKIIKVQLAAQLEENSKLYNYLLQVEESSAATLPPDQLESQVNSDTATYNTLTQYLVPTKTPITEKYQISLNANSKVTPLAKGAVNIAPKHRVELSAGFAFTINKPDLITVSGSGSTLAISRDNSTARFIVGANFYPFAGGLYHLDNRCIIHRGRGKTYDKRLGLSTLNRFSLFLGLGIPQPLQNFYSGVSADLWPGIRLNAGLHWLYYTRYQIVNSQISSQRSAIDDGRIYLGLTINPSSLVNFLNIFKKS